MAKLNIHAVRKSSQIKILFLRSGDGAQILIYMLTNSLVANFPNKLAQSIVCLSFITSENLSLE